MKLAEAELQYAVRVPGPLFELYRKVLREGHDLTDKVHVQSGVWSVVMAPLKSTNRCAGRLPLCAMLRKNRSSRSCAEISSLMYRTRFRHALSMLQGYSEALLDDIAASPEERKELVQVIYDESLAYGPVSEGSIGSSENGSRPYRDES